MLGLLAIVIWRGRKQDIERNNRKFDAQNPLPELPASTKLDRTTRMEMPDSQLPWELDHRAVRVELEENETI